MADSTVRMMIDREVTRTLVRSDDQKRLCGLLSTLIRLSKVGGIGSDMAPLATCRLSLKTLISAMYRGMKNTPPTTSATSGRSHGTVERIRAAPPFAPARAA